MAEKPNPEKTEETPKKTIILKDSDPDGKMIPTLLMAFFETMGIRPWDSNANK